MTTICQSCGMPMSETVHFGTEPDGTVSEEYCTYCYQAGRFVDEGIRLPEKIAHNVRLAVSMGMPEIDARELAENTIPTLKRWLDQ
ncbi:hypothetical protein AUK40_02650 [Candidatus Wirthbacteria bacterium CG2_30_54_11]|uniref:Putative zinc ribbon domain-containing protein n=1 Tax=Candidatus Wirthbacteria bacterium CG2_30_54_11 TaxID=1817892 RepID=A0A1J5IL12_9BACT|nr:MAG: hypothetical protein AUK40_02650 [Candidatus Wirthbacteria bacterium CG2_30_54_11]